MIKSIKTTLRCLSASAFGAMTLATLFSATPVQAMPALKSNIIVESEIVTAADMFVEPGMYAELAIFRAPNPGTAGEITLEAVKNAALRIGLTEFDAMGLNSVRVARAGTMIDQDMLNATIAGHLYLSGAIREGMQVSTDLSTSLPTLYAEKVEEPVTLQQFRFLPNNNSFNAQFIVAGRAEPLAISGRLFFTVNAPHLVRTLPAGSIIQASDIRFRPISAQLADAAGVPSIEDLIGKQTQRQMREGILLRTADIGEPTIIARNETVTLILQQGSLTLTVRGQALNDASRGETVSVLNLMSNRVVSGTAIEPGAVRISTGVTTVASL